MTGKEQDRVAALIERAEARGIDAIVAAVLAEELVKAQRTTAACAGTTSGDLVKGSAAAMRAILRALADLGLLAAPPPPDPFAGLDGEVDRDPAATDEPAKRPRGRPRKSDNLDEALGV